MATGLVGLGSDQNKIPTGGDFVPSGMIGMYSASVLYMFYSKTDIAVAEIEPPKGLIIRKFGANGFRYYHKDNKQLDAVREALGEQYPPKQSWVWQTQRDSVTNINADNLAKFGEVIVSELSITTLNSKKSRHELHMIALPALVHSVARALAFDVPDVSFSMLIGNQVVFDDAFQVKMIGNGDVTSADQDGHYTKSLLWQQRAALWQALGENDATKYQPIKTGTKFDTTSDKLSQCLQYLTHDWAGMWCRVVAVPDPRTDAIYGDESKRLTIPALTEIFASEKSAREAGAKELAERAQREGVKVESSSNGANVPEAWQSDPESWTSWIAETKQFYAGKAAPVVRKDLEKRIKSEDFGATIDEIMTALK